MTNPATKEFLPGKVSPACSFCLFALNAEVTIFCIIFVFDASKCEYLFVRKRNLNRFFSLEILQQIYLIGGGRGAEHAPQQHICDEDVLQQMKRL